MMSTRKFFNILVISILINGCTIVNAYSQKINEAVKGPTETSDGTVVVSPSSWLHQSENLLILIESRLMTGYDTSFMGEKFGRLLTDFQLIENDFSNHGSFMRRRALDDTRAKLVQLQNDIDSWSKNINKINQEITADHYQLHKLKNDSMQVNYQKDSLISKIYQPQFDSLNIWIDKVENNCSSSLEKFAGIENKLNLQTYKIATTITAIDHAISITKTTVYKKSNPAIWELTSNSYPDKIWPVFVETVKQNAASLKFYGKNAYIRAILFRILVLIVSLFPVWYFKKKKKEEGYVEENQEFTFLHKYAGSASASFALLMSPFVFINAPHIFLEAILAMLAITTTYIYQKEKPFINKGALYAVLAVYLLLKFSNLLVTVTLFGRILWTLSIFLLIPLMILWRGQSRDQLRYKSLATSILVFTIILFCIGWVLNVTGHFPLGRIIILAGLDGFFLSIVLFVAIFSFIDFIRILASLYNKPDKVSQIRVDLIFGKLLNVTVFIAGVFWVLAFLKNTNAFDFVKSHIQEWLSQSFQLGEFSINIASILLFLVSLYFAFYLSGLLNGLFYDEKRSTDSGKKTNLGSYIFLLRLMIISAGFVVGMLVAGIPLSNINLIIGAFSVGIGFGLQHIINNLISGIIIAFEKPIYVGDIIEVDGVTGKVTDIGMRATKVDTSDGAEYIIPNGELISKKMKNWTLSSKKFKVEMNLSVSHYNDIQKVTEIIQNVLSNSEKFEKFPEPSIILRDIKSNSLEFVASGWVNDIAFSGNIRNEVLTQIYQSLLEANVTFPKSNKPD